MSSIIEETFRKDNTATIVNDCVCGTPAYEIGDVLEINDIYTDPELNKYSWKLVDRNEGPIAKKITSNDHSGFFLRAPKGVSTSLQTCFSINKKFDQFLHNIIVAEKDSRLNITTGCVAKSTNQTNSHQAVTEIYVEEDATLVYTMIHSWSGQSVVTPKTVIKIEDGGSLIMNYALLGEVRTLISNPKIYMEGERSRVVSNSFVYSRPKQLIDTGAEIHLNGIASQAAINSSFVCTGGHIVNKSTLVGNAEDIRAHIECNGLMTRESLFETTPKLIAKKPDLDMTHEASIGKIADEQIEYLETKGFTSKEARDLIINGFIDDSLKEISPSLQDQIKKILTESEKGF